MEKLNIVYESLNKVRLENLKIYDISKVSILADYIVIASGNIKSISSVFNYLEDDLAKEGYSVNHIEGLNTNWVLVDLGDIIIHLFDFESRNYFELDKLFIDVKEVEIKEEKAE